MSAGIAFSTGAYSSTGTAPIASAASVSRTTTTTTPTQVHLPFSWSSPPFVAAGPGNRRAPPQSPSVPSPALLTAVSCPSRHLCVVTASNGEIWTSEKPLGPSAAWKKASIPGSPRVDSVYGRAFVGVSCSSNSFCAVVDSYGAILVSKDPTGGRSAWVRAFSDPDTISLNAIACIATALCVASNSEGDVVSSLDPGASDSHWTVSHITSRRHPEPLLAVACPSLSYCIAVSSEGHAYFTDKPGESRASWSQVQIDTDSAVFGDNAYGNELTSLSCPSTSLCVASDADGNVLSTTRPTQKQPWNSITPFGEKVPSSTAAISCASVSLCAYVDQSEAFVSHDPTGDQSAWQGLAHPVPGGYSFSAVGCAAPDFCMLAYPNGDIMAGSAATTDRSVLPAKAAADGDHSKPAVVSVTLGNTVPRVVIPATDQSVDRYQPELLTLTVVLGQEFVVMMSRPEVFPHPPEVSDPDVLGVPHGSLADCPKATTCYSFIPRSQGSARVTFVSHPCQPQSPQTPCNKFPLVSWFQVSVES